MTALEFVLLALAAYRLTRLVAVDTITQPARDWIEYRVGGLSHWYTLVTCPFCVGFWVSAAVAVAAAAAHIVPRHWEDQLLLVWALAGLQSLLSSADARMNREE